MAKTDLAVAIHSKGCEVRLYRSTYAAMRWMSSRTMRNEPRRMAWRVIMPNQITT